jgi:hypothetical protein
MTKWKRAKGKTTQWPNEKGQKDKQHNDQMKKGKRTDNTMTKWKRAKGCCLSFCPFSFGYCVVCPFALFHLVIVLSVLLPFFIWSLCCLSLKGQKDRQHNDQMKKGKRKDNTMTKWKRAKGFGHCVICPFALFHLVIVLFVLLPFFIWSLCCLSFCPFSFGHCVVCPFALFHLVIVLFVLLLFFIWSLCCLSFCP